MQSRRAFLGTSAAAAVAGALRADPPAFRLKYLLATPMYGTAPLAEFLPEVKKGGADFIDLWPKPHGNQREQLNELGEERFTALLHEHGVKLGAITRYDLGPFKLQDEMKLLKRLGGSTLVCGSGGPKGLSGDALKEAVFAFCEKLKPHAQALEEQGLTLGIENHKNSLIQERDAVLWFAEKTPSPRVGLAFGPHHFPQDAEWQAKLIRELGAKLVFFYAQQHGKGATQVQPVEDELLQLPGRGPLDFAPLVRALRDTAFGGFTEIYLHPFPRGRRVFDEHARTTAEIVKAKENLERALL